MLTISSMFTAIAVLFLVSLSFIVIRNRYRSQTALGDGVSLQLKRAVRAQGNYTEYTPFFLLLLVLLELSNAPSMLLWVLGAAFFIGRLSHAFSMLKHEKYNAQGELQGFPIFRTAGMILTQLCLMCGALVLLARAIMAGGA